MQSKTLKVKEEYGKIVIKKKLEAYQIVVLLITVALVIVAGALIGTEATKKAQISETLAMVLVAVLLVGCISKFTHFFIGKITVDPLNRILYVKKLSEKQVDFSKINEITTENSRGRKGTVICHLVISTIDEEDIFLRMTSEKQAKEVIELLNNYVKTVKEEI